MTRFFQAQGRRRIGSDHRKKLFGIDPFAQRRRSDKIDKDHGKLSPFGIQACHVGIGQGPHKPRPIEPTRFCMPAHAPTMFSFRRTCNDERYRQAAFD